MAFGVELVDGAVEGVDHIKVAVRGVDGGRVSFSVGVAEPAGRGAFAIEGEEQGALVGDGGCMCRSARGEEQREAEERGEEEGREGGGGAAADRGRNAF